MTKRSIAIIPVLIIFCLLIFCTLCPAAPREFSAWVAVEGPWGVWKHFYDDHLPVRMIVKDLADLGAKEIFVPDASEGLLHPTQVKYASRAPQMGDRDFLEELLVETGKYNMDVVLIWTPDDRWCSMATARKRKDLYCHDENNNPIIGAYPHTGFFDLASPVVKKMYLDLIEELAVRYLPRHKNLKGIYWHELGVGEGTNEHRNRLNEFKSFCMQNYNEAYTGTAMPDKADLDNRWWRRYVLYKNDVLTSFIKDMSEASRKHGLKTYFCYYPAEVVGEESWKWGFDPVALEGICDYMWFAGFPIESPKPYQLFKGSIMDFGPSYAGQNLARNYSSAFHGRPLSIWENRATIYLDMTRKFYADLKSDANYDYYTRYLGHSQKEVSLFLGKENLSKWVEEMSRWSGGDSAATVAVAVNPVPFVLQNRAPGGAYNDKVKNLMVSLSSSLDVDGLVLGSQNMNAMLKGKKLLIIPEQMGIGLDKDTTDRLLKYMSEGGKVLLINSPLVASRPDLTERTDLTEKLFGIKVSENVSGKFDKISARLPLNTGSRTWISGYTASFGKDVEVLATDSEGNPLLSRKGNFYYSAVAFAENLTPFMSSLVNYLANPIVSLIDRTGELLILETVQKDGLLCVPLFGKGRGTVAIDTSRLSGKKADLSARDIVTGQPVQLQLTERGRKALVQADIRYTDQPYILALGNKKKLLRFQGMYPSEDVFAGMEKGIEIENPQVPIAVPAGEGLRIGVYYAGYGTQEIITALKDAGKRVFSLPRLDAEGMRSCDILIVPQMRNSVIFYNQVSPLLRKWVEDGGNLLLTHNAVGFRGHNIIFPEIGKASMNPKADTLTVFKEHPLTKGMTKGKTFSNSYADYIEIVRGSAGEVIIAGEDGQQPVVVAGTVGKGRVILNGMIPGYGSVKKGEYAGIDKKLADEELTLLLNSMEWLGGR